MSDTDQSHARHTIDDSDVPLPRPGAVADDRDTKGRFATGNRVNLVVGHRSMAFWRAQAAAREEIETAMLSDMGYTVNDAPRAAKLACEAISQAVLITRSAFERIGEAGGP